MERKVNECSEVMGGHDRSIFLSFHHQKRGEKRLEEGLWRTDCLQQQVENKQKKSWRNNKLKGNGPGTIWNNFTHSLYQIEP
jgi:hypothetical protein